MKKLLMGLFFCLLTVAYGNSANLPETNNNINNSDNDLLKGIKFQSNNNVSDSNNNDILKDIKFQSNGDVPESNNNAAVKNIEFDLNNEPNSPVTKEMDSMAKNKLEGQLQDGMTYLENTTADGVKKNVASTKKYPPLGSKAMGSDLLNADQNVQENLDTTKNIGKARIEEDDLNKVHLGEDLQGDMTYLKYDKDHKVTQQKVNELLDE